MYAPLRKKDGCVLCAAGKYSLREGPDNECVPCPAGGNCIAGGDEVTFAVGNWSVVDRAYCAKQDRTTAKKATRVLDR